MGLPEIAAFADDAVNRRSMGLLVRRGWRPRVIGFIGYGSSRSLHILGRVVLGNPRKDERPVPTSGPRALAVQAERGWRAYFTVQVPFHPIRISTGDRSIRATTDRGGYIDVILDDHGLEAGWHNVTIEAKGAKPVTTKVLVVDSQVPTGIVSDIDDTIMVTMLPRMFLAAWNTFVRHSSARNPVPGMAELYKQILAEHPEAPVFYLSTGAWNALPNLRAFIKRHGYPDGPLFMTDWGPTATSMFRSGVEHKRTRLRDLMITFPDIQWILIGDDGQHDPMVYEEVAREHPAHVAAIAIRQLSPAEQVLSHGTPESLDPPNPNREVEEHGVPLVTGRDGHELQRSLPTLVGATRRSVAAPDEVRAPSEV
jgi:phosphatidate phosphatase APP1